MSSREDISDKVFAIFIGLACLLIAILFAARASVSWYRSGLQAEVYRREGIEMTQWEVFMNVKPAERTVNIK